MISFAIYISGVIFYAVFASGEQQPWANGPDYCKANNLESSLATTVLKPPRMTTVQEQQGAKSSMQIGINVHCPQTAVHRIQKHGKDVYLYGEVEERKP